MLIGVVIFPKHKDRKLYDTKYQDIYGDRRRVLSASYIKCAIICRVYSERK